MKLPQTLPIITLTKATPIFRVFTEYLDSQGNRCFDSTDWNNYPYLKIKNKQLVTNDKSEDDAFLVKKAHRFSPFIHQQQLIPAMYCGTSENVAFGETLFRNKERQLPTGNQLPLTQRDLNNRYITYLLLTRDINLCSLTEPFLKGGTQQQFNFTADQSINANNSKKGYTTCHQIAKHIYLHDDKVDGLYWESRHLSNNFNFVLWQRDQDSCPVAKLSQLGNHAESPLFTQPAQGRVIAEAIRQGIPADPTLMT